MGRWGCASLNGDSSQVGLPLLATPSRLADDPDDGQCLSSMLTLSVATKRKNSP
jgi:hypothetical protein